MAEELKPLSRPSLSRSVSSVTDQGTEGTCLLHVISNIFVHNISGIYGIVLPRLCNDLLDTYTFFNLSLRDQYSAIMDCMVAIDLIGKNNRNWFKKILLHLYIYSLSKSICGGVENGDLVQTEYLIYYQNLLVDIQHCIMTNEISKDFESILYDFNSYDESLNIYTIFEELLEELKQKSSIIMIEHIPTTSPDPVQGITRFLKTLYVGLSVVTIEKKPKSHALTIIGREMFESTPCLVIKNSWGDERAFLIDEKELKTGFKIPKDSRTWKFQELWCIYPSTLEERVHPPSELRISDKFVWGEKFHPISHVRGKHDLTTQPFLLGPSYNPLLTRYNGEPEPPSPPYVIGETYESSPHKAEEDPFAGGLKSRHKTKHKKHKKYKIKKHKTKKYNYLQKL